MNMIQTHLRAAKAAYWRRRALAADDRIQTLIDIMHSTEASYRQSARSLKAEIRKLQSEVRRLEEASGLKESA